MDDWWTSIQFKIGTCVIHIAFFCFQIMLVAALEIHRGTWQFLRLFPREICIFSNVRRKIIAESKLPSLRHWSIGLASSGASLNSWGEVISLALVDDPSSDGVTIKMLYGVDVLHRPASPPSFPIGLVKTDFIDWQNLALLLDQLRLA